MVRQLVKMLLIGLFSVVLWACSSGPAGSPQTASSKSDSLPGDDYAGDAFEILTAGVKYEPVLDAYLFTMETVADAASVAPVPVGRVNGAPVLGYVFATNLAPSDIGYHNVEGTVALALTSHPDFDDTPLWDEDNNDLYDDDGIVYHSHWVVLEENELASEGLAVVQANESDVLTPTSPMSMYLDSPGFTILEKGNRLTAIVPANAVKRRTDFTASALTAYMEVDTSGIGPLLKVERIYSQWTTAVQVERNEFVAESNWPDASVEGSDNSLSLTNVTVDYVEEMDSLIFTLQTLDDAATKTVIARGQVDGAPVLGYVIPTTISPESVGFKNVEGATVALAVTTHPDFDDTPFWDENGNSNYQDDGAVYHTHWVALVEDGKSEAGLSVPSSFNEADLPPTAPMSMYLDSPNFHAYASGNLLRVIVPVQRIDGVTSFNFDGVTAGMNVDLSGDGPVLRVNEVHDILSGDLSLPYVVTPKQLTEF